jgi:hypothetical protein
MKKIHLIGMLLIPLLLTSCGTGPSEGISGGAGNGFEKPAKQPPGLELKVPSRPDLTERVILVPSGVTRGGIVKVREIESSMIAVDDLMTKESGYEKQNKYLRPGMWLKIPADPENPENKKYTVKMVFTNIDIYVDSGAGNRRMPFDIRDPDVLKTYREKNLDVPQPVTVQFDVGGLKAYSDEVKKNYLNRYLQNDGNYVDVQGLYYLVPHEKPDWRAIRAETSRAENPASIEDFLIDGRLFGTWYPIENMQRTSEAKVSMPSAGVYMLEVYSWPSDDRSHVGF